MFLVVKQTSNWIYGTFFIDNLVHRIDLLRTDHHVPADKTPGMYYTFFNNYAAYCTHVNAISVQIIFFFSFGNARIHKI